jgi:hypothetical protein
MYYTWSTDFMPLRSTDLNASDRGLNYRFYSDSQTADQIEVINVKRQMQ